MVLRIFADLTASISGFKTTTLAVFEQGEGFAVAVLMDKLEDIVLAALVNARTDQPEVGVNLDDLKPTA